MKKSKIIALTGIIISILVIVALGVNNLRPYLSVSKVLDNPDKYDNSELQVKGIVEDYIQTTFSLTEGSDKITVNLGSLVIPEEFESGIDVVITGIYYSAQNEINASQIITQCSN